MELSRHAAESSGPAPRPSPRSAAWPLPKCPQFPKLSVRAVLTQTMPSDTVPAMANDAVPEKVAWVLVRGNRVLVTRSHGRDRFYFPGGHREPGESDSETLVREIDEELQTAIDSGSMVHFGTFEIGEGHPDHDPFRMICYTADHRGELTPSREIAEKAWFCYADRDRVSAVDEMAFDALHETGRLS
jgi:8-oxo-dGTP diphosphatase